MQYDSQLGLVACKVDGLVAGAHWNDVWSKVRAQSHAWKEDDGGEVQLEFVLG